METKKEHAKKVTSHARHTILTDIKNKLRATKSDNYISHAHKTEGTAQISTSHYLNHENGQ